jgi:hypothetical protein
MVARQESDPYDLKIFRDETLRIMLVVLKSM